GRVLKHWRQRVDTPVANIALPIAAEWVPGVTVHATVLDAADDPFGRKALLADVVQGTSVDIRIDAPKRAAALTLDVEQSALHPGDELAFTLSNTSPRELQVTLAVVDDAALALMPEYLTGADPAGEKWLGLLGTWDQARWYSLADWPRLPSAAMLADPGV